MRSKPLPKREKDIGDRLRIWRETLGLSRAKLVEGMRISPQRLAHIEEGNAPLRWDFARMIFSCCAINPGWVATGKGPPWGSSRELINFTEETINPRALYSEVFDQYLAEIFEPDRSQPTNSGEFETPYFGIGRSRLMALHWLPPKYANWLEMVPDIMVSDFIQKIAQRAEELIALYKREAPKIRKSYPTNISILADGLPNDAEAKLRATIHGSKILTATTVSSIPVARHENPSTTEMQNNDIAQRITAARKTAKLSQIAAAQKWEISLGTLRDWEQGRSQPRGLYRTRIEAILAALEA